MTPMQSIGRLLPARRRHRLAPIQPANLMTKPPTRGPLRLHPAVRARIDVEVRAEVDNMIARLKPFGPLDVPASGLCHTLIRETFQGHQLEWWCVQDPGHDGPCNPARSVAVAEVLHLLPLDHADAHGCLDAPEVAP